VKQFFWSLTLPLGTGPDEFGHLSYLQFLLEHHTLPIFGQATLYDFSNLQAIIPLPTVNWIAQHPPLYYLFLTPFYALSSAINPFLAIYLIRIISTALALTTLYGAYKAIRLLNPAPLFAETSVAFIAFLPMFSYLTATVNNDNLLIALATWLTYFLIKELQNSSPKNISIIGILFALCLLTKFISAPLIVGLVMILLLKKPKNLKGYAARWLPPILLASLWYFRNFALYGRLQPELKDLPFTLLSQTPELALNFPEILHQSHPYNLFNFLWNDRFPLEIYKNFWGVFGTLSTQLSAAQYFLIFLFTAIAMLGLIKAFFKHLKSSKGHVKSLQNRKISSLPVTQAHNSQHHSYLNKKSHILLITMSLVTLFAMSIKIYQISASRGFLGAAQGRYMFILLIPVFYFLLLGFAKIFPPHWHTKIFTSLIILLVANDFFSIFFIILPQVF